MTSDPMLLNHLCILAAGLMPIACAGIAKWGAFGQPRSQGGYDNHDPRTWLARQTGWRQRANAAQANCFEALPLFIAGVLIAERSMATSPGLVQALAVAFVLLRIVYVALYVADRPALRSGVWLAAMAVNVALFFV